MITERANVIYISFYNWESTSITPNPSKVSSNTADQSDHMSSIYFSRTNILEVIDTLVYTVNLFIRYSHDEFIHQILT